MNVADMYRIFFLIYCPHWSLCCRWFGVFCQTATVPPDVAGWVGAVLVSSGLYRNQELHLTDIADATRSPMAALWPCFYHCLQSLPIIELAQTFDIQINLAAPFFFCPPFCDTVYVQYVSECMIKV